MEGNWYKKKDLLLSESAASGASTGILYNLALFPADTVKSTEIVRPSRARFAEGWVEDSGFFRVAGDLEAAGKMEMRWLGKAVHFIRRRKWREECTVVQR